jgi:hypothetical protein
MARRDHRNIATYWCDTHIPGLSLMHADFTSHDYAPIPMTPSSSPLQSLEAQK